MRLIDADKLRKKLLMMECMEDVVEVIDSQSTAFDIDKVVEELENQECEYQQYDMPTNDYECGFEGGCEYAFRKAIEIVKAGGQNDD